MTENRNQQAERGGGEGGPSGCLSVAELADLAKRGELEAVVCAMPDLWGRLVGKRVTANTFLQVAAGREALHASLYLFVVDMDMDPRPGYSMTDWEDGFRDFQLVPDLATLRVATWLERTAIVICDPVYEETGEPVEVAPRNVLKRQLLRLEEAGISLKCATELEFFLYADEYREAWERRYRDLSPLSYYRADYHVLQSTRDEWFLRRVREAMDRADIEVEFSKSEWGLGQQEVNLRYADALEMADRHLLYKGAVKEMAALSGLAATFMAKPDIDEVGSSCHVHLSLWDAAGERPLFPAEGGGASPQMSQFIAGQAEYGPELAVFFAPNVNSYKRFQQNQFAGVNFGWAHDNRSAGLRIVGDGDALRVEHRIPGADANPYLAIAAMTAAGMAGIERQLPCPQPLDGDSGEDRGVPMMPRSLDQGLALLEDSEVAREFLGGVAFDHLRNFFRQELDAFRHETVTDWELVRYFERA